MAARPSAGRAATFGIIPTAPLVSYLSTKGALLTASLVLGALPTLTCGGGGTSSPSPSPSPITSPPPASSPSLPDLSGDWMGTLESSSFPTRTIAARFIQMADCVDGSWNTVSESRWVGAISAFARPGSLDGQMSFEFPGSGSRLCSGVGNIKGEATNDRATLTWTMTSYNTDTCTSGGVPNQMLVNIQHK